MRDGMIFYLLTYRASVSRIWADEPLTAWFAAQAVSCFDTPVSGDSSVSTFGWD